VNLFNQLCVENVFFAKLDDLINQFGICVDLNMIIKLYIVETENLTAQVFMVLMLVCFPTKIMLSTLKYKMIMSCVKNEPCQGIFYEFIW